MSDDTSNLRKVLTNCVLHRTIVNYAEFAGIGVLLESVNLHATNNRLTRLLVPLLYDSILTIPDEVDLIWRRRLSAASVIFILNRVGLALSVVSAIMGMINTVRQHSMTSDHYHSFRSQS